MRKEREERSGGGWFAEETDTTHVQLQQTEHMFTDAKHKGSPPAFLKLKYNPRDDGEEAYVQTIYIFTIHTFGLRDTGTSDVVCCSV